MSGPSLCESLGLLVLTREARNIGILPQDGYGLGLLDVIRSDRLRPLLVVDDAANNNNNNSLDEEEDDDAKNPPCLTAFPPIHPSIHSWAGSTRERTDKRAAYGGLHAACLFLALPALSFLACITNRDPGAGGAE